MIPGPSKDQGVRWLDGRSAVPGLSRTDLPLVVLAGAVAVFLTWVLQMPSSLWIDELGTFWVIDGDLASTASRAWRFQGQTPLYYALLWLVTQLFGTSEVVLRLPSLLSMLAAAYLVYRFTSRLFSGSAALVALVLFMVHPNVRLFAADARPYSFALLATVGATMLLESWIRTADRKRAIWYGLAAAAVVYAHYIFATVLVAHALHFAWVVFRSTPAERRHLRIAAAWAMGVFFLVTAPTVPQVTALLGRSSELVLSSRGDIGSLIEIWAPPVASVVLLAVLLLAVAGRRPLSILPGDPLVLLGFGFVVPPLVLFTLSQVSDIVLWSSRYWFVVVPYGAMLFGALIASGLHNPRSTKVVALGVLLVGMLVGTSFEHSSEDWRSAASFANSLSDSDTNVLLFSGLIELTNPEYLVEPEKKTYVTSPDAYYPFSGRVSPLPWVSSESPGEALLSLEAAVASHEPILVITNEPRGSPFDLISGWLLANGYERTTAEAFGSVRVAAFSPG